MEHLLILIVGFLMLRPSGEENVRNKLNEPIRSCRFQLIPTLNGWIGFTNKFLLCYDFEFHHHIVTCCGPSRKLKPNCMAGADPQSSTVRPHGK